jgi:5-methylcytosine-specific restriction endonuclease McrA
MAQEKNFDMAEEFAGLDFHSIRLEDRFVRTMNTQMKQPDKSIRAASNNRDEARVIYRMLGNEDCNREEIIRTHRETTIRRISGYGKDAEVDHKDPYSRGRPTTLENAQIAHRYCNRHKSNKTATGQAALFGVICSL